MERYNQLYKVAKAHYPNEGGFCTVIATAVATGWGFGKARSLLYRKAGRVDGRGSYISKVHEALESEGYHFEQVGVKSKTLITVQKELANTKGTYFVYTARHVTAIKDGVCEDWSNNEHGRPTRYAIESVYKVTKS
jgi:hypothetical protein